ncbi:MAG: primosomal protein N' [Candidatus Omnitrophota bacterium]|nr:primosomal protein N' [Candidatus Omnitrophota bacterium]MBU1929433.1 primosomal protein N' [Candidatus Omnitrophota bacterium]MBU2034843.1 primosomal protein N' [Candidatus Omnitrophota bacterium]MBU2221695.1 primosomal protein N' [Candidatus Omnitrophota bacterium]MBU2258772.1 primosomal protein N' [Candidatus Omnitrophota bacterium]
MYAKVVFGLPLEGPFDYLIPADLEAKIKPGSRVKVSFGPKRMIGYVVMASAKSSILKIKPILEAVDDIPVLDRNLLSLTKELSEYYGCSWGEAIETAIPDGLRKGKKFSSAGFIDKENRISNDKPGNTLILDQGNGLRWDIYIERIKTVLTFSKSVIVILPDIESVFKARDLIGSRLDIPVGVMYRNQPDELEVWLKAKKGATPVIAGTRSAIFAPRPGLGLIIIDEEEDYGYKQDQVPHYNVREIAFMRAKLENADLILGSRSPSLESFYHSRQGELKYEFIPRKKSPPEVKIMDIKDFPAVSKKGDILLTRFLQDSILEALANHGKALIFLNRKGFATFVACRYCGKALKCPRCNISLVYHFKDNLLSCNYCNFKLESPPKICPECNSGYIRYSGIGTEKIESELSRIYPQARIKLVEIGKDLDMRGADIFVSTQEIIRHKGVKFDLIGVLAIDNSLNHFDFRGSEKTFSILAGLAELTDKLIIIQTGYPTHHVFKAVESGDPIIFYDEELKQRQQLGLPPYKHLGIVKLRGKKEEKVKESAHFLFDKLSKLKNKKGIKVVSVSPGIHPKLRGNYYWQVLLSSNSPQKIVELLKINLKGFKHSGIIVTVDIDPV